MEVSKDFSPITITLDSREEVRAIYKTLDFGLKALNDGDYATLEISADLVNKLTCSCNEL